ncbi:MAG: hypothetical protein RPT95_15850 [Candidatus Sedimenticola sp. (ex Thyasira tokunagai)]
MGGLGSGNWYRWDKKTTAEEVHRVDIRYLKKQGYLVSGYSGWLSWSCGGEETGSIRFRVECGCLVLIYRSRSDGSAWVDMEETVWFDRTPCNYGGERLWLSCPDCGKRVAVLYGHGPRFLCRHCHGLPYGSQNETRLDRLNRKARKIRKRLGASDDEMVWRKPKGMHWKTFDRLIQEEQAVDSAATLEIVQKMGAFDRLGWL